mmetsp:Transcript_34183/g.90017  ORF Transcript_34183/g.90017 Transcript_34183/m.90017 type:complete len:206 (-) Transcript_34183:144-761(-)
MAREFSCLVRVNTVPPPFAVPHAQNSTTMAVRLLTLALALLWSGSSAFCPSSLSSSSSRGRQRSFVNLAAEKSDGASAFASLPRGGPSAGSAPAPDATLADESVTTSSSFASLPRGASSSATADEPSGNPPSAPPAASTAASAFVSLPRGGTSGAATVTAASASSGTGGSSLSSSEMVSMWITNSAEGIRESNPVLRGWITEHTP